jgi:hypothetical protein
MNLEDVRSDKQVNREITREEEDRLKLEPYISAVAALEPELNTLIPQWVSSVAGTHAGVP